MVAVFEIQSHFQSNHILQKNWRLQKDPEFAYIVSYRGGGVEIEFIFALHATFPRSISL